MLKKFMKKNQEAMGGEMPDAHEIVINDLETVADVNETDRNGESIVESAESTDESGEIAPADTCDDIGVFALEQDSEESKDDSSEKGDDSSKNDKNTDETEDVFSESGKFYTEARAFSLGRGMSEDQFMESIKMLREVGNSIAEGRPTVEAFELVARGLDFERAVAQAFADGELAGRNARIEMEFMGDGPSDGLPHLASTGGAGKQRNRISSIFDLAREA